MQITPPRFPIGHEDRILDLEQDIEGDVSALISDIMNAGYSREEASVAIISLVDNLMLMSESVAEVDSKIAELRRKP